MHRRRQKILLQVLGPWHLGQPSSWDRRLPLTPPPPPPAWQGPPPCLRCHSPQAGSRRRGIRNSSPGGEAPGSSSAQLPESGPGGCRGLITNGSCLAATLGGPNPRLLSEAALARSQQACFKGSPSSGYLLLPPARPPQRVCLSRVGAQDRCSLGGHGAQPAPPTQPRRTPACALPAPSRGEQMCEQLCTELGLRPPRGWARAFCGQGHR